MLKSRTTSAYIWLWFITEKVSGSTAICRHIPKLTRSNSSAVIKCYRRLYRNAVQCVLCCLFPWTMLWTGITRLRQLPSTSHPYWQIFNFEYRVLLTFAWLSFHTHSWVIFNCQMVMRDAPLLELETFPTDSRHLCLWLVISQRPSGALFRASPVYPCINFPLSPIPRLDPNIGLHWCYRSRSQKHFPVNTTSMRSWLINRVPVVFGPWIHVSLIEIPQENLFPADSISIGSRSTNGVSRYLDLGFMFPSSSYPWEHSNFSQFVSLLVMFFWPWTDRQTDKL